jgi:peptide chain release factor 2
MRRLAELKKVVERWRGLERRLADLDELISLESDEEGASLDTEIQSEIEKIASQLDQLEFQLVFNSEYDSRNAILAIHAGAGGAGLNARIIRLRYWIPHRVKRPG